MIHFVFQTFQLLSICQGNTLPVGPDASHAATVAEVQAALV